MSVSTMLMRIQFFFASRKKIAIYMIGVSIVWLVIFILKGSYIWFSMLCLLASWLLLPFALKSVKILYITSLVSTGIFSFMHKDVMRSLNKRFIEMLEQVPQSLSAHLEVTATGMLIIAGCAAVGYLASRVLTPPVSANAPPDQPLRSYAEILQIPPYAASVSFSALLSSQYRCCLLCSSW